MSNGKLPNTGTMKPMPYKPGTSRAKTMPYTPGTGRTKTLPLPYKPPIDARDVFEKAFDTTGPMSRALNAKRARK